jgi:hypothetical protein
VPVRQTDITITSSYFVKRKPNSSRCLVSRVVVCRKDGFTIVFTSVLHKDFLPVFSLWGFNGLRRTWELDWLAVVTLCSGVRRPEGRNLRCLQRDFSARFQENLIAQLRLSEVKGTGDGLNQYGPTLSGSLQRSCKPHERKPGFGLAPAVGDALERPNFVVNPRFPFLVLPTSYEHP